MQSGISIGLDEIYHESQFVQLRGEASFVERKKPASS